MGFYLLSQIHQSQMSHGYFLVYCEAGAVSTLIKLSQRDATQANAEECMRLLDSLAELRDVLTNVSFTPTLRFLNLLNLARSFICSNRYNSTTFS